MGRKPTPDARDNLLDAAERLFNAHGVHAVGLQQIINECGCGKNMLYREFRSKDDLIVGYLQRSHQDWMCMVDAVIAPLAGNPGAQIIAVVKAAAAKATVPDARGCPLRNTHAEFPEADHPAHQVAVEHFDAVRAQLLGLARQTGTADPEALTDRLLLIIDGLYASGGSFGGPATAVAFAEEVVQMATRPAAIAG